MKPTVEILRAFAYTLPSDERRSLLDWLRTAERLMTPYPAIKYSVAPDLPERRRRAHLPRPNRYYPGTSDYLGQRAG